MLTSLPQLSGDRLFLTDGGLETSMIFHNGLDLPLFASYKLLEDNQGRQALRDYFSRYLAVAREHGAGFILDTATWRSNSDGAPGSATTRRRSTRSTARLSSSRRRSATRTGRWTRRCSWTASSGRAVTATWSAMR